MASVRRMHRDLEAGEVLVVPLRRVVLREADHLAVDRREERDRPARLSQPWRSWPAASSSVRGCSHGESTCAHGVLHLDVRTYVVEVVCAEPVELHASRMIPSKPHRYWLFSRSAAARRRRTPTAAAADRRRRRRTGPSATAAGCRRAPTPTRCSAHVSRWMWSGPKLKTRPPSTKVSMVSLPTARLCSTQRAADDRDGTGGDVVVVEAGVVLGGPAQQPHVDVGVAVAARRRPGCRRRTRGGARHELGPAERGTTPASAARPRRGRGPGRVVEGQVALRAGVACAGRYVDHGGAHATASISVDRPGPRSCPSVHPAPGAGCRRGSPGSPRRRGATRTGSA